MSRRDGFALPVVIWGLGAIALLLATYVAGARYRSIQAVNVARRAEAEALATIGVNIAILDILSGLSGGEGHAGRFEPDGRRVSCTLGGGSRLAIAVQDEGGKVDLNRASPDLLEALVRGTERDGEDPVRAAKAILAMRGAASPNSGSAPTPAGSGFRSVLDLHRLAGLDRSLARALIPAVTVHSRSVGLDPRVVPSALLATLSTTVPSPRSEAMRRFPAIFTAESQRQAFLVASEAVTASGARASRDALVELSLEAPAGYHIREWRDGSLRSTAGSEPVQALPTC